jgi:RNA polymerase sigma-70 factor (ECF subfamily)
MPSVSPVDVREGLASALEKEGDRLFSLALRVTRDQDLAADAVQSAFAAALESAEAFRGEAALATWLHRIVYNKAVDLLRARARDAPAAEDPDSLRDDDVRLAHAPSWARPERALAQAELRGAIDLALRDLTPLQRAVFEMRDEGGRSTEQVAEALHLTPAAVRVHLHRARLRLRARLSELLGVMR